MYTHEELSAMTVPDLKVIAEEKSIVGYSSMTKADLINAILGNIANPEIPVVVPRVEVIDNSSQVVKDVNDVAPPTISATDRETAIRDNIRQAMADKVHATDNVILYPSPYGHL